MSLCIILYISVLFVTILNVGVYFYEKSKNINPTFENSPTGFLINKLRGNK